MRARARASILHIRLIVRAWNETSVLAILSTGSYKLVVISNTVHTYTLYVRFSFQRSITDCIHVIWFEFSQVIKKLLVTLLSFEVHNEITASPCACVSYFTYQSHGAYLS